MSGTGDERTGVKKRGGMGLGTKIQKFNTEYKNHDQFQNDYPLPRTITPILIVFLPHERQFSDRNPFVVFRNPYLHVHYIWK